MALAVPPGGPTPPLARSLGHSGPFVSASPAPAPTPIPATRSQSADPRHTDRADLSVVIVNFCQWRNTARLVRQLRHSAALRTGAADIVVVDNHSPSHPAVRQLQRMEGVVLRRFSRNHGFARAVNRGCQTGASGWVLLLNPDVSVPDGFLDEALSLVERLSESEPEVGVVGFRLRNADGSRQASSGPFPTLSNTVAGLLRPRSRRKCRHHDGVERQRVAWVTGGCLLVRRECFDQLGGLDESFFLYYEDVDFCRRAVEAGWGVWYDPSLEVTHHWPLHARRVPAPLRLMTRHALLTYARKHWEPWQAGLLAGLLWGEASARQVWAAIRGDRDSARCHGEIRRLVHDVCRGRVAEARKRIRSAAAFLDPIAAEQDGRKT